MTAVFLAAGVFLLFASAVGALDEDPPDTGEEDQS